MDKYAASLGLAVTPRLRFLERDPNLRKGLGKSSVKLEVDSSDEDIFDVKEDKTEITKLDELEIEADLEKKHSKPEKAKKLITKAIRNQEKKSVKIASDDEDVDEDEDEDEDFDITKAKDRLALADVDDRAKEKQTKKEKRLEKKMKEKERKRAILEGKMKNIEDEDEEAEDEDQEVDFNPETKSFLDALTLPGGESDSDDDRKSYNRYLNIKRADSMILVFHVRPAGSGCRVIRSLLMAIGKMHPTLLLFVALYTKLIKSLL